MTVPPILVEVAHEHGSLTRGFDSWRDDSQCIATHGRPRQPVDLRLRQTSRFCQEDTEIGLSYWQLLGGRLNASIEAAVSPTHRVLPHHTLGVGLRSEFAPAWLAHSGFKSTRYRDGMVRQGLFMLEHYFLSFSAFGAWSSTSALGKHADSFALRGSHYNSDKNAAGALVASGQDVTDVGNLKRVLVDVRSMALTGRHWFLKDWALTYVVSRTRQRSFYTRTGLRIGVQHVR